MFYDVIMCLIVYCQEPVSAKNISWFVTLNGHKFSARTSLAVDFPLRSSNLIIDTSDCSGSPYFLVQILKKNRENRFFELYIEFFYKKILHHAFLRVN